MTRYRFCALLFTGFVLSCGAFVGCSSEDASQSAHAPASATLQSSLTPLQPPVDPPADYIARRPAPTAPAATTAADDLPLWPPPGTSIAPLQPAPFAPFPSAPPASAPPHLPGTTEQPHQGNPAPSFPATVNDGQTLQPFSPVPPTSPDSIEPPPPTSFPAVVPPVAETEAGPTLGDPNPLRSSTAPVPAPAAPAPRIAPAHSEPATTGNPLRSFSLPLASERPMPQWNQTQTAPAPIGPRPVDPAPAAPAAPFEPRIPNDSSTPATKPSAVRPSTPEPMAPSALLPHAPQEASIEPEIANPAPAPAPVAAPPKTYGKLPRVPSTIPKPGTARSAPSSSSKSLSNLPKPDISTFRSSLVPQSPSSSSAPPSSSPAPGLPTDPPAYEPSGGSAPPSQVEPPPAFAPFQPAPSAESASRFLSPGAKFDPPEAAPPQAPNAIVTPEPAIPESTSEPAASAPSFAPAMPAPLFVPAPAQTEAPPLDATSPNTSAAETTVEQVPAPQPVVKPAVDPNEKFDVVRVFYGTDRLPILVNQDSLVQRLIRFTPPLILVLLTLFGLGVVLTARRPTWMIGTTVLFVLSSLAIWHSVRETINIAHNAALEEPKYSAERSDRGRVERGICEVTIPKIHKQGELEGPSIIRLELQEDPDKHIVLRKTIRLKDDAFYEQLRAQVANSPDRELLVFVHGFNVSFEDAARRTAQMAKDLELRGAPVFFSWPADKYFLLTYGKDEASVGWATPHLKQFLVDIVEQTDAKAVNLVAHSMGNRALTTALREIDLQFRDQARLFNQVVLAAPDIDADDFRDNIAPAIQRTAKQVTLYASSQDVALSASRFFHRNARAGDTSRGLVLVAGMHTIDVSAIDGGPWGHSYYGASDPVLRDLHLLLGSLPPERRTWLKANELDGQTYWAFYPSETATAPAMMAPR